MAISSRYTIINQKKYEVELLDHQNDVHNVVLVFFSTKELGCIEI